MRLTKLKRKILLVLLHSRRTPSVEELSMRVYPEKRITVQDRAKRAAKILAEIEEKEGPEAARIWQMLALDALSQRKKDAWMPNAATTAVRRALESLRQEGIVTKRGDSKYGHWYPRLTQKGMELAGKINREVVSYLEEWSRLCDVHGGVESG